MHIPLTPAGRDPAPPPRRLGFGAFVAAVTLTALVALAIVAVPLFLLKATPSTPGPPTPAPGVVTSHGPLRFVPDPGSGRRAVAADLSRFIGRLYADAFVPEPQGDPPPSPTPTPGPAVRLARHFTASARATLNAHPDVFGPGAAVQVHNGRITFDGLVTMRGRRPAQAFLTVAFTGAGFTRGTPVAITQKGNVLLVHAEQGWLVGGFDLKLNEVSVTPSPSPTPR